jgi:hypothetical protein
VVGKGGAKSADDHDASISALRQAITVGNSNALVQSANLGLELVDAIEGLLGG